MFCRELRRRFVHFRIAVCRLSSAAANIRRRYPQLLKPVHLSSTCNDTAGDCYVRLARCGSRLPPLLHHSARCPAETGIGGAPAFSVEATIGQYTMLAGNESRIRVGMRSSHHVMSVRVVHHKRKSEETGAVAPLAGVIATFTAAAAHSSTIPQLLPWFRPIILATDVLGPFFHRGSRLPLCDVARELESVLLQPAAEGSFGLLHPVSLRWVVAYL